MDAKYTVSEGSKNQVELGQPNSLPKLQSLNLDPIYKRDIAKRRKMLGKLLAKAEQGKEHTIVVVSSLSFDSEDIKDIKGVVHYESRGLWEVLKASADNTKIVFITSLPISEDTLNHLLSQLPNGQQTRERITLLSLNDSRREISLTEKILENSEFISKIKDSFDPKKTYLQTFISSDEEYELAEKLGIPLFGADPKLAYFQTKSGNRQIFTEAGVAFADGYSDIKSSEDLKECFVQLWAKYPSSTRFMLKLDTGVSGNGNAIVKLPISYEQFCQVHPEKRESVLEEIFEGAKFQSKSTSWKDFKKRLVNGAVLETFIEGEQKSSPSAQALIHPNGHVEMLSTHEQILDDSGMTFLGSVFPAKETYRKTLQDYTQRIGDALSKQGILGTIAVDFLLVHEGSKTEVWVIEINVRRGGTTHPYQTAKLVTDSKYDLDKGILVDRENREIHYISDDNIVDQKLQGHTPKEFLDYMQSSGIIFNSKKQSGVVFHLLEAIHEHGKLGYTAIGTSPEEAGKAYDKALALIDSFIQK